MLKFRPTEVKFSKNINEINLNEHSDSNKDEIVVNAPLIEMIDEIKPEISTLMGRQKISKNLLIMIFIRALCHSKDLDNATYS